MALLKRNIEKFFLKSQKKISIRSKNTRLRNKNAANNVENEFFLSSQKNNDFFLMFYHKSGNILTWKTTDCRIMHEQKGILS